MGIESEGQMTSDEPRDPQKDDAPLVRERAKTRETRTIAQQIEKVVWRYLDDEEVQRLKGEIKVNKLANGAISNPTTILATEESLFEAAMARSGASRLVDLGSSQTAYVLSDWEVMMKSGIREYIGVDIMMPDTDWQEKSLPDKEKSIRFKWKNGEILEALHSFPDNFANAWMTGIEAGNVINNFYNWGVGVLSELKRIVPENGFIYTDFGFLDTILFDVQPNLGYLNIIRYRTGKELTDGEKNELEKYSISEDDKYFPGMNGIVIDMPTIGFRVYYPYRRTYEWMNPLILVNISKTKSEERTD
ncbi:MAG: hypothetical protein KBC02_02795 [Candidatus Pacebacteria bacterium]|nr:hypothetical protein [Candidatus Paceibacterota bacterium]